MINDTIILIIGSSVGFSIFMYAMMSTEGIFYRPSTSGDKEFTMKVFIDYLKAPFDVGTRRFNTVWANYVNLNMIDRMKLLQMNWLAMTALGLSTSALIVILLNYVL